MQFDGTSFVQGASRGIGLELVRQLLGMQPGGRVIAFPRGSARRTPAAAEVENSHAIVDFGSPRGELEHRFFCRA